VKKISMLIAVVSVLGAMAQSALAQNLVAFSGGIGDITTGSADTAVFGVPAAGQIWVIRDLQAEVRVGGLIQVDGRGLLLGAGNAIGSNAGASVFATLFCANDGNVQHSTSAAGVPLQVNGDFRIQDSLSPAPPDTCTSPVLLIRVTANGSWFAAGIPFLMPSFPLPPLAPTRSREIAERLQLIQNAAGAILSTFDSWLVMRGIKALPRIAIY
jgi:Cys/Met metabolism PLP-dependent enzyme